MTKRMMKLEPCRRDAGAERERITADGVGRGFHRLESTDGSIDDGRQERGQRHAHRAKCLRGRESAGRFHRLDTFKTRL